MSSVPAIADHADRMFESVAAVTHTQSKCAYLGKSVLTVTKKNPGQSTLPGLLQVVASACRLLLIPAAGTSGDGVPPGLAY
jgi:hypothetical protein